MSVSYTYGQLASQIAFELGGRTDLLTIPTGSNLALSPIQQAIQAAIAKWEREHFYFNEAGALQTVSTDKIITEGGSSIVTEAGEAIVGETSTGGIIVATLKTAVGQEFYDSTSWPNIDTIPHIDKIWVFISGNRYSLNPRTEQYLSDTSLNPSVQGQPIDYAYYAEAIRLYPIPDGVYPITIEGTHRFTTLSADTDSNVWTTDAADLIRAEALAYLWDNVIKQPDQADRQRAQIYGRDPQDQGYIHALRSEGVQKPAVLKARAWYF
jgi:hypothetical protein